MISVGTCIVESGKGRSEKSKPSGSGKSSGKGSKGWKGVLDSSKPCPHWAKFACRHGDQCKMSHEGPGGPSPAASNVAEAQSEGQSKGKGKSGAGAPAAAARVAGVNMTRVTSKVGARAPAAAARVTRSVFQRLAELDETDESDPNSEESCECLAAQNQCVSLPHSSCSSDVSDQDEDSSRVLHPASKCTSFQCKVVDNAEHHSTVANVGTDVVVRGAQQFCKSEVSSSEPASDSEHESVHDQFVSENVWGETPNGAGNASVKMANATDNKSSMGQYKGHSEIIKSEVLSDNVRSELLPV